MAPNEPKTAAQDYLVLWKFFLLMDSVSGGLVVQEFNTRQLQGANRGGWKGTSLGKEDPFPSIYCSASSFCCLFFGGGILLALAMIS